MRLLLILILTASCLTIKAQDTLTIMAYNILNYPLSNPTKADTLKPIIKATNPDIFLITELTSSSGATSILNDALNVDGINFYQKAAYQNGPDTDNMLFYNSDKLTLKSQHEIPTVLRNISEYILYVDNGFLTPLSDTIFIHCYMAHLKASNTPEDSTQRNQEAVIFKNYLDSKPQPIENIIFGGDFNLYTGEEAAYNTILNGGNIILKDPINSAENWHNNYLHRQIHTQSTRTSNIGDGGSWGGMDDRFDLIFTGEDIINGTNDLTYIPNSYKAYGNDGNHFNKAINGTPTNTAVPSNIANALFYMSDHLPVIMKVYHNGVIGINETNIKNTIKGHISNNNLIITSDNFSSLNINVYDLLGRNLLSQKTTINKSLKIDLQALQKGLVFVNIKTSSSSISLKGFLK